jgi:hypothetical protein
MPWPDRLMAAFAVLVIFGPLIYVLIRFWPE